MCLKVETKFRNIFLYVVSNNCNKNYALLKKKKKIKVDYVFC